MYYVSKYKHEKLFCKLVKIDPYYGQKLQKSVFLQINGLNHFDNLLFMSKNVY